MLKKAGFGKVRTYIQSGNALVDTDLSAKEVETRVHDLIKEHIGADLAVVARTGAQLQRVLDENPFQSGYDISRVFFVLFAEPPSAHKVKELLANDFSPEKLAIKTFTRNISMLNESPDAISRGDLRRDVPPVRSSFPDETVDMRLSIHRMMENLRELVMSIREISERVSESAKTLSSTALEINPPSEEVALAVEQISRGAEKQADMVGRSSKVIHEMAISIELVAKRAREAAGAARETSITARRGGDQAGDLLERMRAFFDRVEQSGKQFMEFNAKLQRVG